MGKLILKRNLTNKHPKLIKGVEAEYKFCHRGCDALWNVYFPSIGETFLLPDSNFEYIISEEEKKEKYENLFNSLKIGTNIVYSHGPRGGNKYLYYSYFDTKAGYNCSTGTRDKELIEVGLKYMIENNIHYEETIL